MKPRPLARTQLRVSPLPRRRPRRGALPGPGRGSVDWQYRTGVPGDSRGAAQPDWLPRLQEPGIAARLADLEERARQAGRSLFEYSLRTTAGLPGITSLVLGVTSIPQLEAAAQTLARS